MRSFKHIYFFIKNSILSFISVFIFKICLTFFGLIFLYFFNQPIYAYIFFCLVGISNGLANVLGSSTWAEIYGVKFIGGIKALTTALMVFSTAFGTAVFGYLIDLRLSIELISLICIFYIVVSLLMLLMISNKINPVSLKKA